MNESRKLKNFPDDIIGGYGISPEVREQEPRPRQARPNQLPPPRKKPCTSAGPAVQPEDDADGAAASRAQDPRTHSDRVRRAQSAWDKIAPIQRESLLAGAAEHAKFEERLSEVVLQHLHQRCSDVRAAWEQQHSAQGCQQTCASTSSPVRYVGMQCSGQLDVPGAKCACGAAFTVSPLEVGCFPSSPVQPDTWYDLKVMRAYAHVAHGDGLSSTGFAELLAAITGAAVDQRQFSDAYFAFMRVGYAVDSLKALGVEGVDKGPLMDCPVCAQIPGPSHPYRLAVAADAVTKVSRYKNCGNAATDLPPQLQVYFGRVDKTVTARVENGTFSLKHTLGREDDSNGSACACSSSLHCSRKDATAAGVQVDRHGVVGAVCMHGVPVRGSFIDMHTSEQFSYYLLMLHYLASQRSDLADAYIDFGCKLKSTWGRYVEQNPMLKPVGEKLRIMVNWLHGSGHELACQLANSGRYQEGAGRRIGEEIEQLWSMLKPVASLVRYMSPQHRRDFLEATLASISQQKRERIVELLQRKYNASVRLLEQHRAAVESVRATAAQAGVLDIERAAEQFKDAVLQRGATAVSPDAWKADYVQLCLRLRELQRLQTCAASIAVVSSASAVTLTAASTREQIAKLETSLQQMEAKYGLTAAQRSNWLPGHADYNTGLRLLVEREVERCQLRIEEIALEVQQLYKQRQVEGTSDKEGRQISKQEDRRRAKARSVLEELYVWQSVGAPAGVVVQRLTNEEVKAMFEPGGRPVWSSPAVASTALHVYHGRLYAAAKADLERTEEEIDILRVEKSRLRAWVLHTSAAVQEALQKQQCAGRRFLLQRHLKAIENIKEQVERASIPDP